MTIINGSSQYGTESIPAVSLRLMSSDSKAAMRSGVFTDVLDDLHDCVDFDFSLFLNLYDGSSTFIKLSFRDISNDTIVLKAAHRRYPSTARD